MHAPEYDNSHNQLQYSFSKTGLQQKTRDFKSWQLCTFVNWTCLEAYLIGLVHSSHVPVVMDHCDRLSLIIHRLVCMVMQGCQQMDIFLIRVFDQQDVRVSIGPCCGCPRLNPAIKFSRYTIKAVSHDEPSKNQTTQTKATVLYNILYLHSIFHHLWYSVGSNGPCEMSLLREKISG